MTKKTGSCRLLFSSYTIGKNAQNSGVDAGGSLLCCLFAATEMTEINITFLLHFFTRARCGRMRHVINLEKTEKPSERTTVDGG